MLLFMVWRVMYTYVLEFLGEEISRLETIFVFAAIHQTGGDCVKRRDEQTTPNFALAGV